MKETISAETMKELCSFLEENRDKKITYDRWRDGLRLAVKCFSELRESNKEIVEEINELFNKIQGNMKDFNSFEKPFCVKRFNEELQGIYNKMELNIEVRNKIDELLSKEYDAQNDFPVY